MKRKAEGEKSPRLYKEGKQFHYDIEIFEVSLHRARKWCFSNTGLVSELQREAQNKGWAAVEKWHNAGLLLLGISA